MYFLKENNSNPTVQNCINADKMIKLMKMIHAYINFYSLILCKKVLHCFVCCITILLTYNTIHVSLRLLNHL